MRLLILLKLYMNVSKSLLQKKAISSFTNPWIHNKIQNSLSMCRNFLAEPPRLFQSWSTHFVDPLISVGPAPSLFQSNTRSTNIEQWGKTISKAKLIASLQSKYNTDSVWISFQDVQIQVGLADSSLVQL